MISHKQCWIAHLPFSQRVFQGYQSEFTLSCAGRVITRCGVGGRPTLGLGVAYPGCRLPPLSILRVRALRVRALAVVRPGPARGAPAPVVPKRTVPVPPGVRPQVTPEPDPCAGRRVGGRVRGLVILAVLAAHTHQTVQLSNCNAAHSLIPIIYCHLQNLMGYTEKAWLQCYLEKRIWLHVQQDRSDA